MHLIIGADHAGFKYKARLLAWLKSRAGGRYRVKDLGTASLDSTDYPDYAASVARAVARDRSARGILLCGTGIGMAIAANKIRGVRAALAWNPETAALSAEHNHANVLCLPSRYATYPQTQAMVRAYLRTPFGHGRHARRVDKITALERRMPTR